MAAMAPWMWFVGFGAIVVLVFLWPNPILILIVLLGGFETYRRWKQRKKGEEGNADYYRVKPLHRLAGRRRLRRPDRRAGVGMDATFVERIVRRRLISRRSAGSSDPAPCTRRGRLVRCRQTRRTSRKSEATEVRGPPPRRSWRFTALDRRAPQAALHRVDLFRPPSGGRTRLMPGRRGSRPLLPRAVHGGPRRLDRERRAAVDLGRPRLRPREPRLGRQRVHARVRRLPAARRARRRPARPPRGVRRRARPVRARVARRAGSRRASSRSSPRARRRASAARSSRRRRCRSSRPASPRAASATARSAVGRDGGDRRRVGRAARRRPHRDARAGAGSCSSTSRSACWRRSRRCGSCAAARRDAGATRDFDLAGALTVTVGPRRAHLRDRADRASTAGPRRARC